MGGETGKHQTYTPQTNMTMEKKTFEDVSPFKKCDVPLSCYFSGGICDWYRPATRGREEWIIIYYCEELPCKDSKHKQNYGFDYVMCGGPEKLLR